MEGDNSIYLTRFKFSGLILYVCHIIYGYINYFFDFINIFCLLISFFQIYDYRDFRSFIPLSIFSTLYSVYYTYTVSKLIREQNSINSEMFMRKPINQIKRGDILELSYQDKIPADILILTDDFHVSTNELELSGENIVLNKKALFEDYDNNQLLKSNICINQKKNNGFIEYDNKKYKYDENNIVFRGTKMLDGKLKGLVVEIGNDCMIYNIDNRVLKDKTWLYKKVNNITFNNLYYLLIISAFIAGALKYVYPQRKFIFLVKTTVLLLNTVVPLSLQSFYNACTWILSRKIQTENNVTINSHGINCFENNPKYVVTDKTGTITKNQLKLIQVINISNKNNIIEKNDITNSSNINNFFDIMSCTLINTHSTTKQLLKNDEMEYLLLEWCCKNNKIKIMNNNYNEINKNLSFYKYKFNNKEEKINKIIYKGFDYKLGIKYCITEKDDIYTLNIQGTPEMINLYTNKNLINEGEKLLDEVSNNSYRRIICYAKKNITSDTYLDIKNNCNINEYLKDFEYANIYVFEDQVMDDLANHFDKLMKNGKHITILTGDRHSSSVEVGKILGMCDDMVLIDKKEDMNNIDKTVSLSVNGKIFNELIREEKFKNIILNTNKIIVYRATPEIKEKYIQYLKFADEKNQVMMIGDGSNDISAIMRADVGVAVKGESNQIQNISDVVIDSWCKIPELLKNFSYKKEIIEHNVKWVLTKHIMTATILMTMLLISNYKEIRDPTNPFHMLILNCLLFVCMSMFSFNNNLRIINNPINEKDYKTHIHKGIIVGMIIGTIVFTIFSVNIGIIIAIIAKFIYLSLIL
ncbi:soluble P-type ATPase [Catovirus CTV1]|uniref:Soluble P-type ATPase n=1 Tax=Catovirus CTV1 TaxID=1977631 RepID=A0A1V0SAM6_9VIRU|nr:soluble P-type ATPase [Catovirus CTV1]